MAAAYRPLIAWFAGRRRQAAEADALGCRHLPPSTAKLNSEGRSQLARAKDTSRAHARRRTRESLRAEQVGTDSDADDAASPGTEPEAAEPRKPLFRLPNVRADLAALPGLFRTRRLLWLPLVLLVAGLAVTLTLPGLAPEVAAIGDLYLQFFFIPPALFTFFLGGFIAPRASYLVGLLYGLLAGAMWSVAILGPGLRSPGGPGLPSDIDATGVVLNMLAVGAVYGTLAAAFAAWYRDLLRGMQERGKARRAQREMEERAKRREQRHETRRVSKRSS